MTVNLRRMTRFSLTNALLMMTVVALGVCLVVSSLRNAQLNALIRSVEAENLKHRNELGIFDVKQIDCIHGIRMPPKGDEPWKYRVYLPPGQTYSLNFSVNRIPAVGIPEQWQSGDTLQPGEYVIGLDLLSIASSQTENSQPMAQVAVTVERRADSRRSKSVYRLSESENDWIKNQQSGRMNYIVDDLDRALVVQNVEEPLFLFRLRAAEFAIYKKTPTGVTSRQQRIKEDCDGFLLWVEKMGSESRAAN